MWFCDGFAAWLVRSVVLFYGAWCWFVRCGVALSRSGWLCSCFVSEHVRSGFQCAEWFHVGFRWFCGGFAARRARRVVLL